MNHYILFLFNLSLSSLILTLSSKDLDISTVCMDNKHPCIPESYDCSEKFYATSISLLVSIKQLLTMIDPNYSSKQGTYKTFPGLQSGALMPRASSHYALDESPDLARYWNYFWAGYTGWCSAVMNTNQYIQIGSSIPFVYEKLIISGRSNLNHWISSFKLEYSLDGSNWLPYKNSQVFVGNTESKEPVELILEPFIARTVRIRPQSWVSYIGGRFEFFVSKAIYDNVLPSNSLISAVASGFKMTSSSVWDNGSGVLKSGLDIQTSTYGVGAWCAAAKDKNQWIMITSVRPVIWKKISTMGDSNNDQWMSSYYITYSDDGIIWTEYKNKQIFTANNDRVTKVEYVLDQFVATMIRIHPVTFYSVICVRLEAYCSEI